MTKILITRPMPKAVEERARKMGDIRFRPETTPLSEDEMVLALTDFDVVLPTLGDQFGAEIFAQVDAPRAKLLANFGVGYNHIDVSAAKSKGLIVTNTPGAVHGISDKEWTRWREEKLEQIRAAKKAVPEVGIGLIITPPMRIRRLRNRVRQRSETNLTVEYARDFNKHYTKGAEFRAEVPIAIGHIFYSTENADPKRNSEAYAEFSKAGIFPAGIQCGQWSPARPDLIPKSLEHMRNCIDSCGVSRIGHGIIAHKDEQLMRDLKTNDICLEVCPVSNRILDNVPDGLATHPLRQLFNAGLLYYP